MPQPLPRDKSVSSGPNIVLERPELAAQIGSICANWNLIERDMLALYAQLMGIGLPKLPGFFPPTHPVAYQIFDALNSLHARMDLLARLCKSYSLPDESKYFEDKLRPRMRKRFGERSVIAHGNWGICKDYPDALVLMPIFGEMQIYKLHDLEQVSERILKLHSDFGKFAGPIYRRRREQT